MIAWLRPVTRALAALSIHCAAVAVLASLFAAACSDPPNTQYLPIGQRCTESDNCGTSPFACQIAGYPGGYCDKTCATDAECPGDSVCFITHCRRRCASPGDCRMTEGYTCRPTGATGPFCDVP